MYPVWLAFISCHRTPGSMPGDTPSGSKSSTSIVLNVVFLGYSFLEAHILTIAYQKAFIIGPKVSYRVGSHSITLDIDYSPKVLVIPRNSWLRLNMTEKLFTGTLNHNEKKKKEKKKKKKKKNWTLSPCPGGARGQKLVNHQHMVFLHQRFLVVYILTTRYRKTFKLGP